MKLNQALFLSVTTAFVATLPLSTHAIAAYTTVPSMQKPIVDSALVAQSQTVALFSGTFVAGEKPTTGTARIITEGGHRYLELDTAFSTSDQGPDLHVLLDPTDRPPQAYDNQGSTVNLGKLHEYSGAQRYPIPDSVDLATFKSVVIWCRMANATFGYAPLHPASSAQVQ